MHRKMHRLFFLLSYNCMVIQYQFAFASKNIHNNSNFLKYNNYYIKPTNSSQITSDNPGIYFLI